MNSIESILHSLPSREDLIGALPTRDDLIGAVGLQRRGSAPEMLPALTLFGTGMLIGAGLALLFAPRTGQDMRRSLSESMHQYTGYGEGDAEADRVRRGSGSGRQMASQHSQGSQQGRQMSGQPSDPARQMSQSTYQGDQGSSGSGQMQGHTEQQRIEEREHSRSKTPGSRDR